MLQPASTLSPGSHKLWACGKRPVRECGLYGCAILHGILSANVVGTDASFDVQLFCRLVPTYFGMMVAAFVKK